jgi:phosphoribosylaminoimidazole-succinocarboxamide synthase
LPGWRHAYSGKVRDLYVPDRAAGMAGEGSGADLAAVETETAGELDDVVLLVASDRISAYDHILPTSIPDKGAVLTALTLWWFEQLADVVPNHLVSLDVPAEVAGRAMICRRLRMFPVECVARGYLTGSGLVEYRRTGGVCGVHLARGLVEGSRLEAPIFTPATKAQVGEHDENVSFDVVAAQVGERTAGRLRDLTLAVYTRAAAIAAERGLLLADTKFEFGTTDGPEAEDPQIILGDEVLTPDSSRYWPASGWRPGRPQPSFDKQFVRDWLTSPESGWDRRADTPPPPLPLHVVERTRARYLEAYERVTGTAFAA